MADYQRILSYLYRYEKSEKKECLGFIKAEQKSAILKLTIQINDERLLHGMELKLCFYEKQGEHWGPITQDVGSFLPTSSACVGPLSTATSACGISWLIC